MFLAKNVIEICRTLLFRGKVVVKKSYIWPDWRDALNIEFPRMRQGSRFLNWNRENSKGETHLPVLSFFRGIRNHLQDGTDSQTERFMLGLFPMLRGCCVGVPLACGSHRKVPVRAQIGAIRLQAQALVLTLCAVAMSSGQAVPLQGGQARSANATSPVVRTGVALYRGQELHFEVIDGMAVHGGDMVLGTVEEVLEEQQRLRARKDSTGLWPTRRDLASVEDERLWPDGVIPYVIDPSFAEQALKNIDEAINEWNSKTVITLVKRTTEPDYVRFRPKPGECTADLGRKGGIQFVNLGHAEDACGVAAAIHEIGHSVGLGHEHQRLDRDNYVTVSDAQSFGKIGFAYQADPADSGEGPEGPYDYSSIMHYDTVESIPPGMSFHSGRLSPRDIEVVDRLYGAIPTATTISTNPPGLTILVDGENHTTPVRFNWRPGSTHTLEVVSPQTVGAERFIFGRWSDEGGVRRTILADSGSKWYQANYIVQRTMLSCVQPTEVGGVTIRPESPDDFYVQRQPLKVEAIAGGKSRFLGWDPVPALERSEDRGSRRSSPANSSNPAIGNSPSWPHRYSGGSKISESAAVYTTKPIFLVDSDVEGISILAGGKSRRLPWAFPADAYPDGVWVEAPAIVPEELAEDTELADWQDIRYRFKGWSDGGARAHQIRVPASGGRVRLEITREYRLRVLSRNQWDDNVVEILPPSEDGFYAEGTVVQVRANPSSRWRFAGWIGEISGSEPSQTVAMDSAKWLKAIFTRSEPLQPGESKSVTLSSSSQFQLYADSRGHSILAPRDASEITVRFQSASSSEVDLYVRRGESPRWEGANESEATRRIRAEFKSASPGPMETITIKRESGPRLANDVYFVALAVPPGQGRIEGTLSVEVPRSGIVKSRPQALTFVSPSGFDAGPQTIRLTHETTSTARYKIESNARWLMASPQEWVSSGGGVQEVSVVTNTAGLLFDTHRASLTVLKASGGLGNTTWTETGVEIPVTFAVVPRTGTTATSRWTNAVAIDGGPQEGDTYGAGEQIRVAVNFTDSVEVTGFPALNLRVGNRMRQVTWTGRGSTSICEGGYKSLEFLYLVQAEDLDVDGISIGTNAFDFEWGQHPDR